jgi:predicted nucleic acid-binding protein
MILVDTDILSAMAKIRRTHLVFALLQIPQLHITPGVFGEIAHSFNLRRQYAVEVFGLMATGQIQMVYLTQEEAALRDTLPVTLGTGERESIAIAKAQGGIVLSNESRVAHHYRTHGVPCVRLPDILRALWVEGIVSQHEVQEMIRDLQIKDRMQLTPSTLNAIFAEESSCVPALAMSQRPCLRAWSSRQGPAGSLTSASISTA